MHVVILDIQKMKAKQEAAKKEFEEDEAKRLRELEEKRKIERQKKDELKRLADIKNKEVCRAYSLYCLPSFLWSATQHQKQ